MYYLSTGTGSYKKQGKKNTPEEDHTSREIAKMIPTL